MDGAFLMNLGSACLVAWNVGWVGYWGYGAVVDVVASSVKQQLVAEMREPYSTRLRPEVASEARRQLAGLFTNEWDGKVRQEFKPEAVEHLDEVLTDAIGNLRPEVEQKFRRYLDQILFAPYSKTLRSDLKEALDREIRLGVLQELRSQERHRPG